MKTHALLLMLLLLPASAMAKDLPHEVVFSGDDGPPGATLEELDSPEARARWSVVSEPARGSSMVSIALGEQPAGASVAVSGVSSKDELGYAVRVHVVAKVPVESRGTTRPFVVVAYQGSSTFVRQEVRVVLLLGRTQLIPMEPKDAATTRANLLKLSRRQRRRVARLISANRALRQRTLDVNRELLAFAESPEYVAAIRALPFEGKLRRRAHANHRAFLGGTINPFVLEGDLSIKHLSERRSIRRWMRSLQRDYAREGAQIQEHLDKLEAELAEMKAFAARHTERSAESGGIAAGVDRS